MGFDWEGMLGTSGVGLDDAYDAAVSEVMYPEPTEAEVPRMFPVRDERDEMDGLNW
ncbi:hypothetical protein [Amycolatopsis sp. CA-230715]|uniref:hypothetical protein n=1 Tax=Amycolatopsis sp. CA-230715 TaxID=2745196 RepID=UPI001C027BF3|nr:hypothetical protein [Amycolatopsis sp. CA-230715]QWF85603.1 hypothetical protein HUW46_09058 [Amycolatopsis sp. CA-230715]